MDRAERLGIARARILRILRAQGVANLRTLEQKISDAGPFHLRVQPHILTPAKTSLVTEGRIVQHAGQWFHRSEEDPARIAARLSELDPLWTAFTSQQITLRTGQALEIAVFRAILSSSGIVVPLGGFADLSAHGDDHLYSKQELHNFNGRTLGKQSLDFIVAVGGDYCGIEVKNIRPWLYPHANEVRDAVRKALTLGVIPVLVARRIAFVSFHVLGPCGVVLHETYNQRMAHADNGLADRVRHKDLLGYHDIRVGNTPDDRLVRFITKNLPALVGDARAKLAKYHDLLWAFATGAMGYQEFAARVRRRRLGQREDNDWEVEVEEESEDDPDFFT